MFLYPLAITLILLGLFGGAFAHDRTVYRSVTAFTLAAAFFDLIKALPQEAVSALFARRRDRSRWPRSSPSTI